MIFLFVCFNCAQMCENYSNPNFCPKLRGNTNSLIVHECTSGGFIGKTVYLSATLIFALLFNKNSTTFSCPSDAACQIRLYLLWYYDSCSKLQMNVFIIQSRKHFDTRMVGFATKTFIWAKHTRWRAVRES